MAETTRHKPGPQSESDQDRLRGDTQGEEEARCIDTDPPTSIPPDSWVEEESMPERRANVSRTEDSGLRTTPASDPTNPQSQEATGEETQAERTSERRVKEPGLTDRDRQQRKPLY